VQHNERPGRLGSPIVAAEKQIRTLLTVHPRGSPRVPDPLPDPASYEVRLRDGVSGTVCLTGHDRRGKPMLELRIDRRFLCARIVKRIRHWCEENDADVELGVIG
jgi:hypothetical protein